jgi:inward rectifier potassium channel
LVLNAAFAGLYVLVGGIEGGEPGSFADAFFFSVQTMSTVGYGQMHPVSRAANIVASVEAMLGMSGFALAAAVLFARVSRPTAHVLFSRVAVVSRHEGRPALMFRCANRRRNQLLEAGVLVTLVRNERTQEGAGMRRFHALALVHKQTPIFALPWTVIHRIDETSPLHGETPQSLADAEAEIVVVLSGIDDVFAQPVHARHSYVASDLRWGACFVDIVTRPRAGRLKVDLRRFHEVTEGPR